MLQHYRLGLTVWSPLASGFLSGKYTRENLTDPENRFSGFDILPFDKNAGFSLVDRLRKIAHGHEASVAQIALAWLLAKDAVSSVILGASKLNQLEDNLGSLDIRLTPSEIAELDSSTPLAPVYPNWFCEKISPDQPVIEALKR
jgi:aryl-alcohol dehydrogenase-like predicted oxidoreductase